MEMMKELLLKHVDLYLEPDFWVLLLKSISKMIIE